MDTSEFLSFSSFENARGVETRLSSTFIDHFPDLVAFEKQSACKMHGQENVSRDWSKTLESIVLALKWEPFSNAPVVLVLLDDEEFGRGLKWLFSRQLASLVDFKYLVILAEAYMDVMVYFGRLMCGFTGNANIRDEKTFQYALPPDILIKSRLFCFSFPSTNFLADTVLDLDGLGDTLSFLPNASLNPGSRGQKMLRWDLLSDVPVHIGEAPAGTAYRNEIVLESPVDLDPETRNALFCIARIQFDIIAHGKG